MPGFEGSARNNLPGADPRVKMPPMSAVLLLMASLAPLIPAAMIAGPVFAQPRPAPRASSTGVEAPQMAEAAVRQHLAQAD